MVDVARLPNPVGHKLASLVKVILRHRHRQRNTIQEGHFASRVPSPKTGSARRVDYRVVLRRPCSGRSWLFACSTPPCAAEGARLEPAQVDGRRHQYRHQSRCGHDSRFRPDGFGKTPSLYALIRSIEVSRANVVTIEDPVEIQLERRDADSGERGEGKVLFANPAKCSAAGSGRDPGGRNPRTPKPRGLPCKPPSRGTWFFSTVHTKDTIGTISIA